MRQKISISIPKPCHENWQAMNTTEKGRFCASCQKDVFDFTKATDRQIIEAYNKNPKLCGRFLNTQLNRDLVKPKEKNSIWLVTTTAIVSFLTLGNQEIIAQEKAKTEQTVKKNISENSNEVLSTNQEKEITGIITDKNNEPIPGTTILVKGTQRGTYAGFKGEFSLKAKEGETLVFSFLGMKDFEIKVTKTSSYSIKLEDGFHTLGIMVEVRKRTFVGRTFNKIKNWFR